MDFFVKLKNCKASYDLYLRLKEYDANVTDLGEVVYVYANGVTLGEYDELEHICGEYGDIESE